MAAELKSIISVYGRMDSSFLALSKKITALGKTVSGMGAAITAVTAPVIVAAKQSLETYTSFDDVLRDIQAVGEYTDTQMEAVSAAARQAGRDTRFMATDAGAAILYLVQAGVGLEDSLDVLPSLLDAASAGGMDLATTADLLISNIYSLNREFSKTDVSKYVDAAVTAADATNTTMEEIMEGVSKAGAVGDMLGDDFGLLTWMGLLSNLNRKGAEAGIDMRNIIISLLAPTDKAGKLMESLAYTEEEVSEALEDINLKDSAAALEKLGIDVIDPATGKMRSLVDIFGDFNAAMANMDAAEAADLLYTIFGKRTLASAQGLMGMMDEYWGIYQQVLGSEGAAATKADVKEGGIGGTIRELSSAIEELQIAAGSAMEGRLGEHMETLRGILLNFSSAIDEVAKTDPQAVSDAVDVFLGLAAAGPTLVIAGKGLQMIGGALPLLATPGGHLFLTAGGLMAVLAGIKGIADAAKDYESIEAFFAAAGDTGAKFVENVADGIENGVDNAAKITGAIGNLFTQINEEEWGTHMGAAGADILNSLLTNMKEIAADPETRQILGDIGTIIGEGIEFTGDFATEIVGYLLSAEGLSAITGAGIEIGGALIKGIVKGVASAGGALGDFMLGMLDQTMYSILSWFGIEDNSNIWNKVKDAQFANNNGDTLTGTELTARYLAEQGGTVGEQGAAYLALEPFLGDVLNEYTKNFSAAGIALSDAMVGGLIQGEEKKVQALAGLMYHGMADGLGEAYEGIWSQAENRLRDFYMLDEVPDLAQLYESLGLGNVPQTLEEAVGERAWKPLLEDAESASEQIQKLTEDVSTSIDAAIEKAKGDVNEKYDAYRDELGVQKEEPPQAATAPPEEMWQYALRMATGGQPSVTVTTGPDAAAAGAEYGTQLQSGIDESSPTANINIGYDPSAVDAALAAAQAQVDGKPLTATMNITTTGGISSTPNQTSSYGTLLKTLNKYAEGGRATQASIFGEAGPEWAIPEEHTQRTADLLASAARASGFTMKELMARTGGMNASATAQFVFSPTIYANDVRGVEDALARGREEMEEWFDRRMRDEERMSYA